MAYADLNTIHNPATGTSPPASWGDQVRDNFEFLNTLVGSLNVAFVDWVPTCTQSVTVAKTMVNSGQIKLGRLVACWCTFNVTGAGTAAQVIVLTTPHTAAHASQVVGINHLYDASANINYMGAVELQTTNAFAFVYQGSNNFGGASIFTAGLALNDTILCAALYESAT